MRRKGIKVSSPPPKPLAIQSKARPTHNNENTNPNIPNPNDAPEMTKVVNGSSFQAGGGNDRLSVPFPDAVEAVAGNASVLAVLEAVLDPGAEAACSCSAERIPAGRGGARVEVEALWWSVCEGAERVGVFLERPQLKNEELEEVREEEGAGEV